MNHHLKTKTCQNYLQKTYQYLLNEPNQGHNLWVVTLVSGTFDAATLAFCTQTLAKILPDYTLLAQTTANSPTSGNLAYQNTATLYPQSQTSPVTTFQWLIQSKTQSIDSHNILIEKIRENLSEFHPNHALNQSESNSENILKPPLDINLMPFATYCRPHRLALFDMDSTLIEQEVIVELAKHAGIGDKVNAITEAAMRGEMDFSQSFTQRVALLEGLSASVLAQICQNLTFSVGAKCLVTALKEAGYHVVLVSGGFTYFAEYVQKTLGIDEIYANALDIAADRVTGKITSPIIDGKRKAEILQEVATRLGMDLSQTVAVGDGANDLPMLGLADIGIAYHAKPIVQAQADYAVNVAGLDGVLAILGLTH